MSWELVSGLETHVELSTNTKIYRANLQGLQKSIHRLKVNKNKICLRSIFT